VGITGAYRRACDDNMPRRYRHWPRQFTFHLQAIRARLSAEWFQLQSPASIKSPMMDF
jgi:hypothetical protein